MFKKFKKLTVNTTPCKCCSETAILYGVVDFNKNCEVQRNKHVLPVSGIPVYYFRCPACQLIFTTFFDNFTEQDFLTYIYNGDYILVDPDYVSVRPKSFAEGITALFSQQKHISILDYGGGNGLLERLLEASGFSDVDTYDPFSSAYSVKPNRRYDCILSFEVFEHSVNPYHTLQEIDGLLKPDGIVIFSTLTQPQDIDDTGLSWWYVGPRNGHVTIHSVQSLQAVAQKFTFSLAHFNSGLHLLFREIPEFARHLIRTNSVP